MPEQQNLPIRAAYAFGIAHGLQKEIAEIRDMIIEWDLAYNASVRKGYLIELFEKHGIFDEFKFNDWPFGNTPEGQRKMLRFVRLKTRYEDFLADRSEPEIDLDSDDDFDEGQSFVREADLRDFLAKNPQCIEQGLIIYSDNGRSGVEFPVENGRIDLLAIDREQRLVVIELKVGRGRNKTIGQLLYYMGWVDKNLSKGKPCRGMIISKDITDDLILAAKRVPGVTLSRYNLSVTVDKVALTA